MVGFWEALVIGTILVLLFGAKKLPDLARGIGAGIRNFKGELKGPGESRDGAAQESHDAR